MAKFQDITGNKYGRLTVIERAESISKGRPRWRCICECGNEVIVAGTNLKNGHTKSCGCYNIEKLHARKTHGMTKSRLYGVWANIMTRCYNNNHQAYKDYGGRGIKMCDEWRNDFMKFYEWSYANGYDENARPHDCTIDRIDNTKGYCPENCRWVNAIVQQNNKRTNRYVTIDGKRMTVADASRIYGVDQFLVYHRLRDGWTDERAVKTPKCERWYPRNKGAWAEDEQTNQERGRM